jgi:hypothetical protein
LPLVAGDSYAVDGDALDLIAEHLWPL